MLDLRSVKHYAEEAEMLQANNRTTTSYFVTQHAAICPGSPLLLLQGRHFVDALLQHTELDPA